MCSKSVRNKYYRYKKKFDPNNIKIDEKSHKYIFNYYTGYVTIKDSRYIKINSLNLILFYILFSAK